MIATSTGRVSSLTGLLLRDRVNMVESNGQFLPDYRDQLGQPLYDGSAQRVTDAKAFVSLYLSEPMNANLVRSNAVPGSGARPQGAPQAKGVKPRTMAEFQAMTPEQQIEVGKTMSDEEVFALAGVNQNSQGIFSP